MEVYNVSGIKCTIFWNNHIGTRKGTTIYQKEKSDIGNMVHKCYGKCIDSIEYKKEYQQSTVDKIMCVN